MRRRAFTLVEIMIVVTIVGLLATLAIPAFKKARAASTFTTMKNDARQLGGAAQTYFMELGVSEVTFTIGDDGRLDEPLGNYVKALKSNYTSTSDKIVIGEKFTMAHALYNDGQDVEFTDSGTLVIEEP